MKDSHAILGSSSCRSFGGVGRVERRTREHKPIMDFLWSAARAIFGILRYQSRDQAVVTRGFFDCRQLEVRNARVLPCLIH
jgi:hypothetical protein